MWLRHKFVWPILCIRPGTFSLWLETTRGTLAASLYMTIPLLTNKLLWQSPCLEYTKVHCWIKLFILIITIFVCYKQMSCHDSLPKVVLQLNIVSMTWRNISMLPWCHMKMFFQFETWLRFNTPTFFFWPYPLTATNKNTYPIILILRVNSSYPNLFARDAVIADKSHHQYPRHKLRLSELWGYIVPYIYSLQILPHIFN